MKSIEILLRRLRFEDFMQSISKKETILHPNTTALGNILGRKLIQKVPDLENRVGVSVCLIKAAKAVLDMLIKKTCRLNV
ncbi:hypothetical protein TNCV_4506601 [Trichonephila clavipes]|nr:hypothetical protein TNCV_4506601 [Trichonephila clavipes]